jgi:pSer/pThr/pTyr-binding forkhead associated (FHA) protein
VADKRLLLGLMVLFRHQPALTFKTSLVDMPRILQTLAERNTDQILALRSGGEWGIALCTKGQPVANFLVSGAADPAAATAPAEQLAAYAQGRADGVIVDVYEETRVGPAGDVILVTPETRGRLVEVFLKVAARVREAEAEAPAILDGLPADPMAIEMEASSSFPSVAEVSMEEPSGIVDREAVPLELEEPMEAAGLLPEASAGPPLFSMEPADSTPEGPALPRDEFREEGPPLQRGEPQPAPLELEGSPAAARAVADVPAEPEPARAPAPSPASPPSQPHKGPAPEILLLLGDKQLGVFSLAGGEVTIGRSPGNTIVIDNAGVSRRHAVIRVVGEKVVLEDLDSANGTFVRGQRVEEYELRDGDEIAIVKHRLVYRIPKESEGPTRLEPMQDVGQRTMYIDAAAVAQAVGGRQGPRPETAATTLRPRLILPDLKKFPLEEDEVKLGSGAGCQIQLSGMFVGKVHAKILRTKEGQFRIHHLSGLAGTRVNGEKIAEHVLKHGDEIEIGKQKLLFRLER